MRPRFLIAAFGLALTLVLPAVSSAATLTFTNANCSDFQISSSAGGNVSLTCVPVVGPVCTLQASTPNPVINTTLTLTAACTGGAGGYTYAWTGLSSACASAVCQDTQATAGSKTYTVTATSGANQGPPASASVTWVTQASTPPTGCSLTANPASLPAGGGATLLTAACSGGGAPTSYSWSGGAIGGVIASAIQNPSITATTTFSVTPMNSAGAGNTATVTVTVAGGGGGPPGGGGGLNFCSSYTNVIYLDVPWGGVADTRSAGSNFLPNGVLVAKFTIPAGWANNPGSVGKVQAAEYGDPPTYRQASLSTAACDFRGVANGQYDQYFRDITGQQPFPLQWAFGNTAVAEFTVTGNALFRPQLQPGGTYYYNVRNWNPYGNGGSGTTSCGGSSCNAIISINTP